MSVIAPLTGRSSNHRAALETPDQSWWLLDAPLEAGHDTLSIRYPPQSPNPAYVPASCHFVSTLQPRRHFLLLARELHAGRERHGFHQGGEILGEVGVRISLQGCGAEMRLEHFPRCGCHRHRHIHFAGKREAEV